MHARNLILALALQFALLPFAFSQNKRMSGDYLLEQYRHFTNTDASLNHRNFFDAMAAEMGLSEKSNMALVQEIPGENGYTHYKYRQFHAGIPIVGNTYILHEKDGRIVKANGLFTPNATADTRSSISPEAALKIAERAMKAKTYAPAKQTPLLCLIDPAFPKTSGALRLAYQVDLQSQEPFDKRRYYVDAQRGAVISQFPLILKKGVPSTADTKYYGTVAIITDSIGPQNFVLRDPTRGEGITVLQPTLANFTSTSAHWNLTNDRKDEVALDAHYCTTRYYDMMLDNFGWQGLDGKGKALKVQVHNNGAGNVNAFWDGEFSNYGDGDCVYGPLTTLEVVGHEFTHGMIDYTSKLVYSSESGAINESMADIFGKTLEYHADPANFSWLLGHSFFLSPDAEPFRVMNDPKSLEMPAFYGGEFWNENSGVHTNSAIGNLWFVLLTEGRQGINEAGQTFNVPALGLDKASQIAFLTNKNYLTENSDYHSFYTYSLDAAEELYGPGAAEIEAVREAWKAVGLPSSVGLNFDLSIRGSQISFVGDTYCGLGQYLPVTVKVQNKGLTPYLPAMNATVTITRSGLPDHIIPVTVPIQPGEVAAFVVNDWLLANDPGFSFVDVVLDVVDDNPDNNFDFQLYQVLEHSASDIEMYAEVQQPPCFSQTTNLYIFITNNSCEPIPAGAQFDLSVENSAGAVLWSENYVLTEQLDAFFSTLMARELNLNATASDELVFRLDYGPDPDPSNNVKPIFTINRKTIDADYLNLFNDFMALDNYLLVESNGFNPLVHYQGGSYYGATGLNPDTEYLTRCPNYEDNFNIDGFFGGVTSTIWACVDFSSVENAVLSFDLAQFRNLMADAEGYLYSSMFQVKWTGNASGKKILAGQNEGQLIHHEFDLPKNFKGELEFKFYTEIGQYGEIQPSAFLEDDVLLLDNLHLKTNTVSAPEIYKEDRVLVSPNPARDKITVRSEGTFTSAALVDMNGKILRQELPRGGSFELNLGGLENGIYFLRLQQTTGEWVVRKIIKMN